MLDFTELLVSSTLLIAGDNRDNAHEVFSLVQDAQEMVAIMMNYNHKHVFSLVTGRNEVNQSHLTHRPISKLITGHAIALQREEIRFHALEHQCKLP